MDKSVKETAGRQALVVCLRHERVKRGEYSRRVIDPGNDESKEREQ